MMTRGGHGPVRLRYLWDSQTVIAVNARGEVLASTPLAELIVEAPRRKSLPQALLYGYELDAIRDAVIAQAHLVGAPAPRGWARPLHGKNIHTSKTGDEMGLSPDVREQNQRRIKELEVGNVE